MSGIYGAGHTRYEDGLHVAAGSPMDDTLSASLVLSRGARTRMGADRVALLEAIRDKGSLTAAAKAVGLSYKGAWDAVQALNNLFEQPLVTAHAGGSGGGGTAGLTAQGAAVVATFHKVQAQLSQVLGGLESATDPGSVIWSLGMRTSARNALRGVVASVSAGPVSAEVALTIAPGVDLISVITRQSVADLGLAPGVPAIALIKANFVGLTRADTAAGNGARNALAGTVIHREDGPSNCEVSLVLDAGKTLTATMPREAGTSLGLHVGVRAIAQIPATHIILAVE
jgi:molybdate transport system regulatory protein